MIFGAGSNASIYLCSRAVDMRKSYDGLCGEVSEFMRRDPVSGDYFVFINKRSDMLKILVWDRHGFWIISKRLEAGRFRVPSEGLVDSSIQWDELVCLIEGIDLRNVRRQRRFSLEKQKIMLDK